MLLIQTLKCTTFPKDLGTIKEWKEFTEKCKHLIHCYVTKREIENIYKKHIKD